MRILPALLVLASLVLVSASAHAEEDAPSSYRPNFNFVVGGLVSASAGYGFAALLSTSNCYDPTPMCQHQSELLIPFAGSMMHAVRLAATPLPPETDLPLEVLIGSHGVRWLGVGILAVDSLVQIGGVTLAAIGLIQGTPAKRAPLTTPETTKPTVHVTFGLSQVGLQGTF